MERPNEPLFQPEYNTYGQVRTFGRDLSNLQLVEKQQCAYDSQVSNSTSLRIKKGKRNSSSTSSNKGCRKKSQEQRVQTRNQAGLYSRTKTQKPVIDFYPSQQSESANQPNLSLRPEPMFQLQEVGKPAQKEEQMAVESESDLEQKLRLFYSEKVPQFVQTQICKEDQLSYGKP